MSCFDEPFNNGVEEEGEMGFWGSSQQKMDQNVRTFAEVIERLAIAFEVSNNLSNKQRRYPEQLEERYSGGSIKPWAG